MKSPAAAYAAAEALPDGRAIQIRALRPEDRAGLLAAAGRTSDQSLYRRFFSYRRKFTDQEIDRYVNVDFVSQVALVAAMEEKGQSIIVGGARYVMVRPGQAEIAFVVDDSHQGKGIGTALLRHLVILARAAGLSAFIADVLPDNTAMLRVFETSGLAITTRREPGVVHVVLQLT